MGLREILEAKRIARLSLPLREEEEKEEEKKEEEITYRSQNIEVPDFTLFLSLYSPYLSDPYSFNVYFQEEYRHFLLGDSTHVIGLFPKIDIETLLALYLKSSFAPKNLREFSILTHFLNHIELRVPLMYQKDFEDIIKKFIP